MGIGIFRERRACLAALAVGAASLVAAGCGSSSSSGGGGKLPSHITIGATFPLTGLGAPYGQSFLRGLTLGLKDSETGLGTTFTVKALDDQANPGPAVTEARQLMTQDGAPAVVTAYSAPPLAELKVAQQYKVPLLNGGGNTPDLPGHEWLFNDAFMVSQGGYAAMKFAVDTLHAKKTSILIDTAYPADTAPLYEEIWRKLTGTTPRVQWINDETTDTRPQINKMLADKPDVMFISVGGTTLSLLLKQLTQLNVQIPFVGNDGAVLGTPEVNTVPFPVYYANPAAVPSPRLTAEYKGKYGEAPDFLAVQNYNLGLVLGAAVKMAHEQKLPINGVTIQKLLSNPNNKFPADGGGALSFTTQHIIDQSADIIKVVKGTSTTVATGISTASG
jgi:ABC-type branched-subunit amino acid transport system substrate-binding protein